VNGYTETDLKILRAVCSTAATVVAMIVFLYCTTAVWRAFIDTPPPVAYTTATVLLAALIGCWFGGHVVRPQLVHVRHVVRDEDFIRDMNIAMEGPDGEEPIRS
jgi:hypothetical protein